MPFLFAFYMLIPQQNNTKPVRPAESINAKTEVFFMQVRQQRPPVADCFHRRSYLFMLSHFHFSDMVVFLTHQPFIIQKSSNIHFFCHNPFHGIFRWNNSVQCLPHLLSVISEDWFQYFYVMMNFCFQRKHLWIGFKKSFQFPLVFFIITFNQFSSHIWNPPYT